MSTVYTASTYIDADRREVFEYVRIPENQPRWAQNFVRSTKAIGGGRYVMETPGGPMTYRVDADPHRGTVDFIFDGAQGESILPARVVAQGNGSIFTFTITRTPDMDDGAWEAGQRGMDQELAQLKRLLEA